jgi:dolichol-phosphate mannosyltransferase
MIEGQRVAVIVPAYRAEAQIPGVLGRMPAFVDRVFVVDDASSDGTGAAVESVQDLRIRLLRHDTNQGVGGAMATGFRAALGEGADVVVKCDADGQMNPQDIGALIRPLLDGAAEYSKGCRFHHASELKTMPTVRRAGNFGLTFLMKLASGYWHVLDPQNGFVAIQREVLSRLRIDRLARDYFFENDLLIRLNALEARVADVPLPSRYGDESSSLKPGRILLGFPLRLIAGFVRRLFWRYVFYDVSPVSVFVLFGSLLFLFGATYGAYHWIWGVIHHQPTQTGTVIVAAVPFILGFQLLLQALVLDIQNSPRAETRRGITAPDPSRSSDRLTSRR